MNILEILNGAVSATLAQSYWLGNMLLFLGPGLLIAGLRNCVMLRGAMSWSVLLWRFVFGIIPVTVATCVVLVIANVALYESFSRFSLSNALWMLAGVLAGLFAAYATGRKIEPAFVRFLERRTIRSGRSDMRTDIREIGAHIPDFETIVHSREFADAVAKDSMFLGIDSNRSAIHIPRPQWKKSHVQIMGPPGTGKGVQAGVALTQSLRYGDAVYVFDPKNDEWAPSVYASACRKAQVPFRLIDLRQNIAQVNPLRDASFDQVSEMFYAGLRLGQRGDPSDFYRLDDREAARQTARLTQLNEQSLAQLHKRALTTVNTNLVASAKGFFSAFREVAELPCVQTREGIALEAPLAEGGCIYIVGSIRDEPVVTLQKMLFVRVVQLLEQRSSSRHCSIFLDEFKYLLSQQTVNALGTIRDKGCNILLAHQSLGDFGDCGADLSESAVRTTVLDTTPIKWLYRPTNEETARWISDQTGQIRIDEERRELSVNPEMVEHVSRQRGVSEATRNLIDVNMVLSLPDRCAVCIGAGTPMLAVSRPMPVEKIAIAPQAGARTAEVKVDLLTRIPEPEAGRQAESATDSVEISPDDEPEMRFLKFIYDETWTHIDIVQELLPDIQPQEVDELLQRMESEKLIRRLPVESSYSPYAMVWGITAPGCRHALQFVEVAVERPSFRKSMVNPITLNHHLDLQRLRLKATAAHWSKWRIGDRGRPSGKDVKHPDAIATRPDGCVVAIELERTIKVVNRYPPALVALLDGRRRRLWDEVYYICKDEADRTRLDRIFSEIDAAVFQGETVAIGDSHKAFVKIFVHCDDWA